MADCAMLVELASGADTLAADGEIWVRRNNEGVKGQTLVLSDWKKYTVTAAGVTLPLEQGIRYETLERNPKGHHRAFDCPKTATAVYATQTWLYELPAGENYGPKGKSTYEIAVEHGYVGTEVEWLDYIADGAVTATADNAVAAAASEDAAAISAATATAQAGIATAARDEAEAARDAILVADYIKTIDADARYEMRIGQLAYSGVAWYEQGATNPDTYAALDSTGRDAGMLVGNTGYARQSAGVPANPAAQSRMHRCVLANDGSRVVYYLDADDSAKIAGTFKDGKQTGWVRVWEGALDPVKPTPGQTGVPNAAMRDGVPAWIVGATFDRGDRVTDGGSLWDCLADSTVGVKPKAGTTAADLSGGTGQVMVEIPAFYYRMDFDAALHRHTWEVAFDRGAYRPFPDLTREVPILDEVTVNGRTFILHPTFVKAGIKRAARFHSAFGMSATDETDNTVGVVQSIFDGAKLNATDISSTNFRAKARGRNTGLVDLSGVADDLFSIADYWILHAIQLLLFNEYRSLYSQSVVGSGNVIGSVYNKLAGRTAALGNASGVCDAAGVREVPGASTNDALSYRGIEDLWGTAWELPDGWNIRNGVTGCEHWVSRTPSKFAWSKADDSYILVASSAKGLDATQYASGLGGGSFLISTGGGSQSTYLTDYFYGNARVDNSWRVALAGGTASSGGSAGVGALHASYGPGTLSISYGAALLL